MKTILVLIALLVTGCSGLPTMQYCDRVDYSRKGSQISIKAECQAPVGAPIPVPIPGV